MSERKTTSFPDKSLEASVVNMIGLDGTPGLPDSAVPKYLLANGYLSMMSIHLFSRNINKKCFILNRKLNEMLLLDLIIYVISVKQEEIFQFGESEEAKVQIQAVSLSRPRYMLPIILCLALSHVEWKESHTLDTEKQINIITEAISR